MNRLLFSVNSNLSHFVAKQVSASPTGTIPQGVNILNFDIPEVEGCKPFIYIANTHGWYANFCPFGNSSGVISPNAQKLSVYYYAPEEFTATGGSATAIIIYVPDVL